MKRKNGNGSVRKIDNGYECLIQSKKCYNANGNPVRIKRRGKTFEEAVKNAQEAVYKLESQAGDEIDIRKEYTSKDVGRIEQKRRKMGEQPERQVLTIDELYRRLLNQNR